MLRYNIIPDKCEAIIMNNDKSPRPQVQGPQCMANVQGSYARVRSMVFGERAGKVPYDRIAAGN